MAGNDEQYYHDIEEKPPAKPSGVDAALDNAISSAVDGGDSEGSDVQAGLRNPGQLPDYLSFLQKPGDEVEDFQPGSPSAAPGTPNAGPDNGQAVGKLGFSYKGSTEHGKKYAGGLFGQADRRIDQFADQDAERVAGEQAASAEHYGNLENATRGEIDATKQYQERDRELEQIQIEHYQRYAMAEEMAQNEAKAAREKTLAGYQDQLAAVRALAAQSGNPMDRVGTLGKIGLIGARFAQGFLAARGINIDVNGEIDRMVDQGIRQHQQQLENARGVANDQLHLYDIARQNSQDDWEARQRYRGFVLEGLKTAVQQNANAFNSNIAMAHANENIAKLQIESDATSRQIADAAFNRKHQTMTTEIDRAFKQGTLGIEEYKAQTERMRATQKQQQQQSPLFVQDPETRTVIGPDGRKQTVQVRPWVIDPNAPKEVQEKAYEKATKASEDEGDYQDKLKRLIDARQAVENDWGLAARAERKVGREDEAWQEYQNAKTDFVNTVIYKRSGKQINDSEFERFFGMVPDQKLLQKGSSARLLNQMQEVGRKEFQRTMSDPIFLKNPDTVQGPDGKTYRNPNKYSDVTEAEPALAAEGRARKAADEGGGPIADSVSEDLANAETDNGAISNRTSKGWKYLMGSEDQPLNSTFVDDLVRGALDPKHYRNENFGGHQLPADDIDLRDQSLRALKSLAAEPTQTGDYARRWLRTIETSPKTALDYLKNG